MKQWLMFFVVGVGYFGGEEGVIVLLWEVGYIVELLVDQSFLDLLYLILIDLMFDLILMIQYIYGKQFYLL